MNLLMVSGDASPAQGKRGPFASLLEEFSRYWDRLDVITPAAPGAGPAQPFANVYFWPGQGGRLGHVSHVVSTGRRLAGERRYGLIASHDYGLFLNGLGAARLSRETGIPYVSEIHHVEGWPRAATVGEALRRRAAQGYVRWAKSRAVAFRAVNRLELPALLTQWGVPAEKVRVLYSLYLDFGVFHPAPAEKEYDVLFAGRLAPNKGLFLLLDALVLVKQARGQVRAAIVGQGALRGALERRAEALGLAGSISWLGWVETPGQLAELYRRSRCLVCASYSEGGPRVVAEALACGTPVISTPVGMARELVREGENGFLFQWSAPELAERLNQLLADEALQRRLAATGPASVARFEKSAVIREYAEGYQALGIDL